MQVRLASRQVAVVASKQPAQVTSLKESTLVAQPMARLVSPMDSRSVSRQMSSLSRQVPHLVTWLVLRSRPCSSWPSSSSLRQWSQQRLPSRHQASWRASASRAPARLSALALQRGGALDRLVPRPSSTMPT